MPSGTIMQVPGLDRKSVRHAIRYYRKMSYHRSVVLEGVRRCAMRNRHYWYETMERLASETGRSPTIGEILDRIDVRQAHAAHVARPESTQERRKDRAALQDVVRPKIQFTALTRARACVSESVHVCRCAAGAPMPIGGGIATTNASSLSGTTRISHLPTHIMVDMCSWPPRALIRSMSSGSSLRGTGVTVPSGLTLFASMGMLFPSADFSFRITL